MKRKLRILFVCVHNSARSQIAEAIMKRDFSDDFEVESAGLEPGTLNPLAVEVMKEVGIDISGNKTKKVFDLYTAGEAFSYVITVCDEANAERCPIFPNILGMYHWSFADPSSFEGSHEEKLQKTREVREAIHAKLKSWVEEMRTSGKK